MFAGESLRFYTFKFLYVDRKFGTLHQSRDNYVIQNLFACSEKCSKTGQVKKFNRS